MEVPRGARLVSMTKYRQYHPLLDHFYVDFPRFSVWLGFFPLRRGRSPYYRNQQRVKCSGEQVVNTNRMGSTPKVPANRTLLGTSLSTSPPHKQV